MAAVEKGQRFGTVVVQACLGTWGGDPEWLVTCDCGASHVRLSSELVPSGRGRRRMVHCRRCHVPKKAPPRHGWSKTPEYLAWLSAYYRCHNPENPDYERYGGRGIVMAPEWHPPAESGFLRFFGYIGPRPDDNMTLDRIDNDDGYRPGNVRWATRSEQVYNSRNPWLYPSTS